MRGVPNNRRSDEELLAAITAHLERENLTRTTLQRLVHIGPDLAKRLLETMMTDKEIESYAGKIGHNPCEIYCLMGRRPRAVEPSKGSHWTKTLAAFREAVYGAVREGRDPFKVAA
jgi:hypothetical protein